MFLKNRTKVEGENSSANRSRKHLRKAAYSDIDKALYRWFLMARQSDVRINGPLMGTAILIFCVLCMQFIFSVSMCIYAYIYIYIYTFGSLHYMYGDLITRNTVNEK